MRGSRCFHNTVSIRRVYGTEGRELIKFWEEMVGVNVENLQYRLADWEGRGGKGRGGEGYFDVMIILVVDEELHGGNIRHENR